MSTYEATRQMGFTEAQHDVLAETVYAACQSNLIDRYREALTDRVDGFEHPFGLGIEHPLRDRLDAGLDTYPYRDFAFVIQPGNALNTFIAMAMVDSNDGGILRGSDVTVGILDKIDQPLKPEPPRRVYSSKNESVFTREDLAFALSRFKAQREVGLTFLTDGFMDGVDFIED